MWLQVSTLHVDTYLLLWYGPFMVLNWLDQSETSERGCMYDS